MRFLFTTSLFLVSTSLLAQYQLRPAQLTDYTDKIITGFVNYYDWGSNPDRIEFGTDSTAPLRPLALRTIRKLTIKNGPSYESLYLKVPRYSQDPVRPDESLVQSIDSTYYLAEVLLESDPVILYRFLDKEQHVRFVIAKYDSLAILEDIHVRIIKKETIYNYQEPRFRETLKALLYECPTLPTTTTLYNERSIIDLLKEYLSFCRIDSKIYLEQKKIETIRVGVGAFSAYWKNGEATSLTYGLSLQLLFPRQFHNVFALLNVGSLRQSIIGQPTPDVSFGLYGGRYFGRRDIQGRIYTGLSTMGLLDTGFGISYRKRISLDLRYPVLTILALSELSLTNLPLLHASAVIPLNR